MALCALSPLDRAQAMGYLLVCWGLFLFVCFCVAYSLGSEHGLGGHRLWLE